MDEFVLERPLSKSGHEPLTFELDCSPSEGYYVLKSNTLLSCPWFKLE